MSANLSETLSLSPIVLCFHLKNRNECIDCILNHVVWTIKGNKTEHLYFGRLRVTLKSLQSGYSPNPHPHRYFYFPSLIQGPVQTNFSLF
jgi:hypothetical protein